MAALSRWPGMAAVCRLVAIVGCGSGLDGQPPVPASSTGTAPAAARQVFFDSQDAFTPDIRAVLAQPADRLRFVAWLRARPAPVSERLVSVLDRYPAGDGVLVVVARNVGCDIVGRVELCRGDADLALLPRAVQHNHGECFRANHLVAVFALPASALPSAVTIDGSPPDTDWR